MTTTASCRCGRHLLVSYLRRSGSHPVDAGQALCRRWPKVEIIFRGDSSFCRWKILRWSEGHDVRYIVGLARHARVKSQAALWISMAESLYDLTGKKQRLFASIHYVPLAGTSPGG